MLIKNINSVKIKKREKKLAKLKCENLEETYKYYVNPKTRAVSKFRVKLYKNLIFASMISSLIIHILVTLVMSRFIFVHFDNIPQEKQKMIFFLMYSFSSFLTFLPYFLVIFRAFIETNLGKVIFSGHFFNKFYKKMDRLIELVHHSTEMVIIAENNVNTEYFLDRCSIASRKALAQLLVFTNGILGKKYYESLRYKSIRQFTRRVDDYIKEINGGIVISFKGRVPRYINDMFEQVYSNMMELRKKEI